MKAEAHVWLPIDSAPKDGSEVLLWIGGIGARPAEWDGDTELWMSPIDGETCYRDKDATHWSKPIPPPCGSEGKP